MYIDTCIISYESRLTTQSQFVSRVPALLSQCYISQCRNHRFIYRHIHHMSRGFLITAQLPTRQYILQPVLMLPRAVRVLRREDLFFQLRSMYYNLYVALLLVLFGGHVQTSVHFIPHIRATEVIGPLSTYLGTYSRPTVSCWQGCQPRIPGNHGQKLLATAHDRDVIMCRKLQRKCPKGRCDAARLTENSAIASISPILSSCQHILSIRLVVLSSCHLPQVTTHNITQVCLTHAYDITRGQPQSHGYVATITYLPSEAAAFFKIPADTIKKDWKTRTNQILNGERLRRSKLSGQICSLTCSSRSAPNNQTQQQYDLYCLENPKRFFVLYILTKWISSYF